MSHNQFQFIGNLTRDIELRQSENGGSSWAFVDIANNRTWKNQAGEQQEATDYFRIKVFGSTADSAAKYLKKGLKFLFKAAYSLQNTKKTARRNTVLILLPKNYVICKSLT